MICRPNFHFHIRSFMYFIAEPNPNLPEIVYVIIEASDEPTYPRSLVKSFSVRQHKLYVKLKHQPKIRNNMGLVRVSIQVLQIGLLSLISLSKVFASS